LEYNAVAGYRRIFVKLDLIKKFVEVEDVTLLIKTCEELKPISMVVEK
jgi:hypothetical protein